MRLPLGRGPLGELRVSSRVEKLKAERLPPLFSGVAMTLTVFRFFSIFIPKSEFQNPKSEDTRFPEFPEDPSKDIGHLTNRGIAFTAVQQIRHHVFLCLRCLLQALE
jgi:hypothetical protein